ncbi:MAG: O-antigen ligase family protein [Betaproteobacteria bacterium]
MKTTPLHSSHARPAGGGALALAGVVLVVLLFGAFTAVLDWDVAAIALTALVPALLMFWDYRIGLALLILILPFENAQFLPKLGPLNALNVLILGVTLAFLLQAGVRRFTAKPLAVLVPPTLFWFYVVPLAVAVVFGSLHFKEMSAAYLVKTHPEGYKLTTYWASDWFKHLLLVAAACVLGSAVYAARSGRRWMAMFALAALVFVLAQFVLTAATGVSLEALQDSRAFFSYLGRQNNEAGVMLVTAFGPLLFMRGMVKSRGLRLALALLALSIVVAVLLTGSRGAFVAAGMVVLMYLLHFRRLRTAFAIGTLVVISVAVAPDAIQERLLRGLQSKQGIENIASRGDKLSAGRIYIWESLAPEIARSPIYGRGLMSTQWSRYVRSGAFDANHPHNLYLEILMDGGVYGAICMFVFYRWVWRSFRRLARDERFDPDVRGFFLGASAGFVGMLTYGLTNGHWYPAPEQVFFWLAIGLAIGYTRIAQELPAPVLVAPRRGARGRPRYRRTEPTWQPALPRTAR